MIRWSVPCWIWLLFLAGCTSGTTSADETAIRLLAEQRRQAIIARDPARYRPLISPHYSHRGQNAAAKLADLATSFRQQVVSDFRTSDLRITVTGNQAVLNERYRLQLVSRGQSYDLAGEETIYLMKEADGWKISGGL